MQSTHLPVYLDTCVGFLAPSSYQVGQDTLSFVAGMAPLTEKINFLAAIRCGEVQPIMLARTVATLDHMLKGRLTLNVISSDFPGEVASSAFRYKRSHEVVQILRQAWTRDTIDHDGDGDEAVPKSRNQLKRKRCSPPARGGIDKRQRRNVEQVTLALEKAERGRREMVKQNEELWESLGQMSSQSAEQAEKATNLEVTVEELEARLADFKAQITCLQAENKILTERRSHNKRAYERMRNFIDAQRSNPSGVLCDKCPVLSRKVEDLRRKFEEERQRHDATRTQLHNETRESMAVMRRVWETADLQNRATTLYSPSSAVSGFQPPYQLQYQMVQPQSIHPQSYLSPGQHGVPRSSVGLSGGLNLPPSGMNPNPSFHRGTSAAVAEVDVGQPTRNLDPRAQHHSPAIENQTGPAFFEEFK